MILETDTIDNTVLLTTFQIGNSWFGIDARWVQEVVMVLPMTQVYGAPFWIKGIMNLRGRIITIIDPSEILDLPYKKDSLAQRIFIINWNSEYIGLLVSNVGEVLPIDTLEIEDVPSNIDIKHQAFLSGVYKNRMGHVISNLNIENLLKNPLSN